MQAIYGLSNCIVTRFSTLVTEGTVFSLKRKEITGLRMRSVCQSKHVEKRNINYRKCVSNKDIIRKIIFYTEIQSEKISK